MKEDAKKLFKNRLYEIKVKRIQNIFDTFYFSSDFNEMIERKLIPPFIDLNLDQNENQPEKKEYKVDPQFKKEDIDSLSELSDLKRKIRNRQIEEQIQEDKKVLGFKISNANETEKNIYLTGKEKDIIEKEFNKIKVKSNTKEVGLLQDQYNVGIIKYDYDPITSTDLQNDDSNIKDPENIIIKCTNNIYNKIKTNFPYINNVQLYDYNNNTNLFLLNFTGNKYSLYYPFQKVVLNEDNINNENNIINENYYEIDSGLVELQLNKRAFILKEVNNIDDDLDDIINIILEFLCGFYCFNQINEISKNNKNKVQDNKNKNFKKNGTFVSDFIDTTKFIESKFDEKEMKLIKEKFEQKEKEKIKKFVHKGNRKSVTDQPPSKRLTSFNLQSNNI